MRNNRGRTVVFETSATSNVQRDSEYNEKLKTV